ncbi:MAG: D-alanyl-D-alanine carboxypeptidase family protein [Armatimonadota bacterium]
MDRYLPRNNLLIRCWPVLTLCLATALLLCTTCGGVCAQTLRPLIVPVPKTSAPPKITAAAGILVDAGTGSVLWSRNANQRRPVASLTKVMTALLLLENTPLDEIITAPPGITSVEASSLHLTEGEQLSARDLLYAIMLRSANDACVAVAHHIAGSVESFAELMNRRASELGCHNTHFANPNGLPDPNHYSSAADMARITLAAIRYPEFNTVVSTRRYTLTRTANPDDLVVVNRSQLLDTFPGADGVKTGYTRAAGRCFIGSATRRDRRVISVVLNSKNVWADTKALLEYGFSGFQRVVLVKAGQPAGSVPVEGGTAPTVQALVAKDVVCVVPKGVVVSPKLAVSSGPSRAPIDAGHKIGRADVLVRGRTVGVVPLIAASSVSELPRGFSGWRWGTWAVIAFVVLRYARKTTEASRRSRPRLKTRR